MPMSPSARASAISAAVTAERDSTTPPSASGTPIIGRPSSLAVSSSFCGVAGVGVGVMGGLADALEREVLDRLDQHLLLVGRGEVEQLGLLGLRLTLRLTELLRGREDPAGVAGGAHRLLRAVEQDPLSRLAETDPVDQLRGGECVDCLETGGHSAVGQGLLLGHLTISLFVVTSVDVIRGFEGYTKGR